MQLKGKQIGQLKKALLSAFPRRAILEQMVRIGLEENLDAIATGNDDDVVFELINWAESNGNLETLLTAARDENCGGNPGNSELKIIIEELLQGQATTKLSHRLLNPCNFDLNALIDKCWEKLGSEQGVVGLAVSSDLLYTYDAINRLYDAQLGAEGSRSREIKNYIRLGCLGRAIARAQYGRRSVVLIDEIDKADLDFPNDLLWELDRLEFHVTEAPEISYAVDNKKPELRPIVFVTHNEEKALPTAFLRRCIFHYVEFPETEELLEQILATHEISNQELSKKAIEVFLKLRKLDLSKQPGLSELLDWVGYLEAVKTPVKKLEKWLYIGALLKQESDLLKAAALRYRQRALEAFDKQ